MEKFHECFRKPDLKLSAVCGLFCTGCTLFIGTQEDPERINGWAERMNRPIEHFTCYGCRSEKKSYYCETICKKKKCADDKGINFCVECGEYPCAEFDNFQNETPHRIELWKSNECIKEVGYEQWYKEMIEHYSCPECNALNSAYDMVCRNCGANPSCEYISLNKQEIIRRICK